MDPVSVSRKRSLQYLIKSVPKQNICWISTKHEHVTKVINGYYGSHDQSITMRVDYFILIVNNLNYRGFRFELPWIQQFFDASLSLPFLCDFIVFFFRLMSVNNNVDFFFELFLYSLWINITVFMIIAGNINFRFQCFYFDDIYAWFIFGHFYRWFKPFQRENIEIIVAFVLFLLYTNN